MKRKIATPTGTKEILKKYNIRLNKNIGQNFLVDGNIMRKIVTAADIKKGETVVEIGAGIGSLTQLLLPEIGTDGKLIAIEKDKRFIPILQDFFSKKKQLEIIRGDALEINWDKFPVPEIEENGIIKIVANLPYYISSAIITKLLTAERYFERMIFMVQKEVAERMVAAPESGDFGLLSVAVQFYSRVEIVHEVSPSVFIPRPEVDSCIIRLFPYQQSPYQVVDKDYFFRVVKAIFQLRRKNIKNALTGASTLSISKDRVLKALKKCEIDPRSRGEKLNIQKMVQLSNQMYQLDK